jgi:hypothetical protein
MAFTRETAVTPVAIADISIVLFTPEPGSDEQAGASYSVQVRMSDGTIKVRTGDLVPHISQAQTNSLLSFMAAMRTKAVAEFLP